MAEKATDADLDDAEKSPVDNYRVVARRFRPQSFADLVGQDQVAKALSNAIDRTRVGHAYLFTGARGVGKTSTARIFAKCLNCFEGPTDSPCGKCDVCVGVTEGEDIDVLEIDGASNRGIEEIRQLRANVNIRPSRARYKIYIIDEVHMLTTPAFNALLKTLEEPPEHVKFFFCTTDPEKIPITVLSRCQRFDLPPISMEQIKQRLQLIANQDQVDVDDEALEILARRANGSMRDSQSLLDQLFSFCRGKITAADVHALLGTADSRQVLEILTECVERRTAEALQRVGTAVEAGVDPGQLTEQLLSLFRDMMALRVGCSKEHLLFCNSADFGALSALAQSEKLEQILAAIDVLDSALTRMKQSTHTRTLLETSVVRICSLPDLQAVADLIEQIKTGQPLQVSASVKSTKPVTSKKKTETVTANSNRSDANPSSSIQSPTKTTDGISQAAAEAKAKSNEDSGAAGSTAENGGVSHFDLNLDNCESVWKKVLSQIDDMTSDLASMYKSFSIDGERLLITMSDAYHRDACQRSERKQRLEEVLVSITGRNIRLDFEATEISTAKKAILKPKMSRVQQIRHYEQQPFVKQAIELFDAEITDVVEPPETS